MTVWPASFFFWGASGICRRLQPSPSIPPTSPREPEWSLFGTPPKPLPQPTSARGPLPQMPQWHPRVAKRSSDRFSARGPLPQVPQRHPRVAKRALIDTLAREPLPQMPQWHPRVAKRASIGTSARGPFPQILQRHPSVAKRALIDTLAREPSTEALLGQGRVPKGRESVPLQGLWSVLRPG